MSDVMLEKLEYLSQKIIDVTADGNARIVIGDLDEEETQDAMHTVLDAIMDLTMVLSNARCTIKKEE